MLNFRGFVYLSSRGDYFNINRHSCEGRNPENSLSSRLDARLRWHDESTLRPLSYLIFYNTPLLQHSSTPILINIPTETRFSVPAKVVSAEPDLHPSFPRARILRISLFPLIDLGMRGNRPLESIRRPKFKSYRHAPEFHLSKSAPLLSK